MVEAAHEQVAVDRLQREYIHLLFKTFHGSVGISQVPNEHASRATAEQMEAAGRELESADVAAVTAE